MKYRVDVHWCLQIPESTADARYVGDNLNLALDIFDELRVGFDNDGNENKQYGVILSVWNGEKYVKDRYKTKRL